MELFDIDVRHCLLVNFSKCEVFSPTDVNLFRGELIRSSSPNIVILGVPIGDLEFCSNYISNKCASAKLLLRKLEEVGAQDTQVAWSFYGCVAPFVNWPILLKLPHPLFHQGFGAF